MLCSVCCVVENLEEMAESGYSSSAVDGTTVIIRLIYCVFSLLDVIVCVIVCVRACYGLSVGLWFESDNGCKLKS